MDDNNSVSDINLDDLPPNVAFGWVNDPEAVESVVAQLPYRSFADTPAFGFLDSDMPDHVYLWEAAIEVTGKLLPPFNQGAIGSCVSFGTNRAIEYTMCVEIMKQKTEEFQHIVQEITYGGSRVEVGKGGIRGDGSIGAWAAKFVRDWGIVARGKYNKYDLSTYSESTCREFGKSGVPSDLEVEAKKHPVKETVMVTTWDQAKKALVQGYGIAICSGQGFSMRRGENGIAKASGSWAHCMCLCGFTTIDGKEYGRIDNSWGPNAHTGPVGPGNPGSEGFYAAASVIEGMLKEKDSFAFSSVEGFPMRKIHWKI